MQEYIYKDKFIIEHNSRMIAPHIYNYIEYKTDMHSMYIV